MKRVLLLKFFLCFFSLVAVAQTEVLTNADILEMTEAGLNSEIIAAKIKSTNSNFDVTTKALINLKKGNVNDEIISLMVEKAKTQTVTVTEVKTEDGSNIVEKKNVTAADLLRSARTVSITKSSINPARQVLEKELLKLAVWQKLNLNIIENDKTGADLTIDIGFVHFSVVTHRYAWRVYDRKTGRLIAAGETTSWGSLSKNLAKDISKGLQKVLNP